MAERSAPENFDHSRNQALSCGWVANTAFPPHIALVGQRDIGEDHVALAGAGGASTFSCQEFKRVGVRDMGMGWGSIVISNPCCYQMNGIKRYLNLFWYST
jgi:hypothetical protein